MRHIQIRERASISSRGFADTISNILEMNYHAFDGPELHQLREIQAQLVHLSRMVDRNTAMMRSAVNG